MFNSYGNDRLTNWKQFRNSLEESATPLEDVAEFWSHAPFVSSYLDTQNSAEWPDPWHLILDDRYDNLAIALGMLYTIKLTTRFMNSKCEIHTSMLPTDKEQRYLLIVDDTYVLNYEYKSVIDVKNLHEVKTSLICTK